MTGEEDTLLWLVVGVVEMEGSQVVFFKQHL